MVNRQDTDLHLYNLPSSKGPVEIRRIPPPPYRHAAPSAPWPWIDIRDPIDQEQLNSGAPPVPEDCDHERCQGKCWKGYPQSRFPNWTKGQVEKCKILDVNKDGIFKHAGNLEMKHERPVLDEQWDWFKGHKQGSDIRVRALFVDNMSGPVLQMLGGKYNIEPFFFSSSLNWIPSRFQEDARERQGDHITITLPFIQSVPGDQVPRSVYLQDSSATVRTTDLDHLVTEIIDTQAPLRMKLKRNRNSGEKDKVEEYALVLDLLSVHLVRNVDGNTIISYHANMDIPTTKAAYLHERIRFAGQSVYWQKMLGKAEDPTFLLLIFIWQAAYAWDEALQRLNEYIVQLEAEVIETSSLEITQQLHIIRAHHLHYSSLLQSFRKAVEFVRKTFNPALTEEQRKICAPLLERECGMLLKEVNRLNTERGMQERRLRNVMNLVFSSVNIKDSRDMKSMTETALKDSAGTFMKQISYLTMIFLPASFANGFFGMNVGEINPQTNGTIPHYVIITVCLTVASIWLLVAFQSMYLFKEKETPLWKKLAWPYFLIRFWLETNRKSKEEAARYPSETPYFGVIW